MKPWQLSIRRITFKSRNKEKQQNMIQGGCVINKELAPNHLELKSVRGNNK